MKKLYVSVIGTGLAGFAALAGCATSTAPISANNDTTSVDNYIQAIAQTSCDWEFKCCKDPEIAVLETNKFTTKDQCLPYHKLSQEDSLYLDRLAVREGRLRFDAAHSAACVKTMTNRVCNATTTAAGCGQPAPVDDCALAFVGNTPVGNECVYANECVDGAHCVSDSNAVGRGVCVPFQKTGDICNADSDCDPKTANIYCAKQDFKCHVRGKSGEACAYTTPASGDATLPMLLECDASACSKLFCDPSSNTCTQLPTDGQPCLAKLPPGVASRCDPDPSLQIVCDSSTGNGTCRAPGKVGADCTSLPCASDLYCTSAGRTCTALPNVGESCSASGQRCQKPYYCNYAKNYVCDQPAALGQDCSSVTCDTGLYCDIFGTTSRVCKTLLADGSTCQSSTQCMSLSCAASVCESKPTIVACTGR